MEFRIVKPICANFDWEQEKQNNSQPCLLRIRWGRCWTSSWGQREMVSDIIYIGIDWWPSYLIFLILNGKCKKYHYHLLHTESCKISNLEFYFLGQIRLKTESISNAFAAPVCTYSRKINNLQGGRIEERAILNIQEQ